MKKIFSTMCLSLISLFGATNSLIAPKSGIVDIGSPTPRSSYEKTVVKEWAQYEAILKETNKLLFTKERNINSFECETDYLGRENCVEEAQSCVQQGETSKGYSERIQKTLFVSKNKKSVPRNESVNPNNLSGDYILNPTSGSVDGSQFSIESSNGSLYGGVMPTVDQLMAQGFQKNGKFAIKLFNYGSGWGGVSVATDVPPTEQNIILNDGSTIGYVSVNGALGYGMGSYNGKYGIVELVYDVKPKSISYGCDDYCLMGKPDGSLGFFTYNCVAPYIDADGIISPEGQCKKDYSYYEYKCFSDKNTYGIDWTGPLISTGGDCNGQCSGNNCECNSPIPPDSNCIRGNYTCPSDPNKLCTITTDDKTNNQENIFNGFVYDKGSSTLIKKIAISDKTCENGMIYSEATKACEKQPGYICLNSLFMFDPNVNECLKPYTCDGRINSAGICEIQATANCSAGYFFNGTKGRCETAPICDVGQYNVNSDVCESKITCPTGYSYSEATKVCISPLNVKDMKCVNANENYIEGNPDQCKTKASLADPIYGKTINDSATWILGNSQSTETVKNKYSNMIRNLGGAINNLTNTSQQVIVIKMQSSSNSIGSLIVNPGESVRFAFVYGGTDKLMIINESTGASISKGFNHYTFFSSKKVTVFFSSTATCNNWTTVSASQNYPEHRVCSTQGLDNIATCPAGYNLGKDEQNNTICFVKPTCPTGTSLSLNLQQCVRIITCEAGYTANYETNKCIKGDIPGATIDPTTNSYRINASCPAGTTLNQLTNSCEYSPKCSASGSLVPAEDKCAKYPEYTCPKDKVGNCQEGYFFNANIEKCEANPTCANGLFNPQTNSCGTAPTCPTAYTFNVITKQCEKELEKILFSCNPGETMIDTETKDSCRISKKGNCNAPYENSLRAEYCERTITCPTDYKIDNVKNYCYK